MVLYPSTSLRWWYSQFSLPTCLPLHCFCKENISLHHCFFFLLFPAESYSLAAQCALKLKARTASDSCAVFVWWTKQSTFSHTFSESVRCWGAVQSLWALHGILKDIAVRRAASKVRKASVLFFLPRAVYWAKTLLFLWNETLKPQ